MATATELRTQLNAKRDEHAAFLTSFKTDDGGYDMPADEVGEFQKRNDELNELAQRYETAVGIEAAAVKNELARATEAKDAAPQDRLIKGVEEPEVKGRPAQTKEALDAHFEKGWKTNAAALDRIAKGGQGAVEIPLGVGLKTLLQTSAHAPQADRQGTFPSALYFGDVEDVFPHGNTTSKSIDYYIQTTDTDNAAAVAEASAVTDSAFAWTLTTDPVETVQTWIPMTHEAVADNVGLQSIVEGMLANRLQKLSNQLILSGTGTSPDPTGVFIRSGFQTQAKGSDPTMDAFHKAITKVNVTGDANANAIFIHPNDWEEIRLTRTADGLYILGNPTQVGPSMLWGLPVYQTTGIGAAGTGGVGDTSWAQVMDREGVVLEISTEHSDYFTKRQVAVMLYRRFTVADYRPSAFATVTGI